MVSSYKDNPDDDREEADGGGLNSNHGGGNNRGNDDSYASIIHHDDDEEDPTTTQQHRRRRRNKQQQKQRYYRPSNNTESSSCTFCACMWLCFMVLLVLAVVGFVVWRIEAKIHPEGIDLLSNQSKSFMHDMFASSNNANNETDNDTDTDTDTDVTSKGATTTATVEKAIPSGNQASIHYNPDAALQYYNPFDFQKADWYGSVAVPPPVFAGSSSDESTNTNRLGFLTQPNMVGQHLVFVTEGDLYYTQWKQPSGSSSTPTTAAMKLTTTTGNVKSPVLNPNFPYYVAFTATYTGHREVYLMDLRPSHRSQPAMRLTYWETSYGIKSIVGWKDNGLTLIFSAISNDATSLPDTRLYELSLHSPKSNVGMQVLKVSPVPLSQALNGVWKDDCLYFTRFQQSSRTVRYVGGTAESLWAWCEGFDKAVALTADYRGTSKNPQIASVQGVESLVFMSDRDTTTGTTPATMNLFSTPLPTKALLHSGATATTTTAYTLGNAKTLTHVSCDYAGLSLQDYTVDGSNAVLRIGADLYLLSLAGAGGKAKELDIVVYSDFHEHQERLLPVTMITDMISFDIYTTAFGSTAALLGVRGQLFVAPVVPHLTSVTTPYAGAGMNLPLRRYRVAPGTTTGGVVRILTANFVPMPQEDGKTTRRLALILATDPSSPTAEHAFYLIETQSDSAPSFVDLEALPEPFLGGSKQGGSVKAGGLGSVDSNSVKVSPCGRRLAWTDTDGRICVTTMPMYQNTNSTTTMQQYKVLPNSNDNGEPMIGIGTDLSWSPGGRYLAVSHSAKNQFTILSIVDCGDPNIEGTEEVADITIGGRIAQATPARFNSESPYWGKSGMDIATSAQTATIAKLMGQEPPEEEGATTLYFLSDRDIVSDVQSPWGTRAPSPHFPNKKSVYALPLIAAAEKAKNNPMNGIYAGGGASELWADGIIDLSLRMEALEAAALAATAPSGRRLLDQNQNHLFAAAAARGQQQRNMADFISPPEIPTPTEPPITDAAAPHMYTSETYPPVEIVATATAPPSVATAQPTATTGKPSTTPSAAPSIGITGKPSTSPSGAPSVGITGKPSTSPSGAPSVDATTDKPSTSPSSAPSHAQPSPVFPNDREIDFGSSDGLAFARKAYRIAGIPAGAYRSILCQLSDDPSLILVESTDKGATVKLMAFEDFPSDKIDPMPLYGDTKYMGSGVSTTRDHLLFIVAPGLLKVVPNKVAHVMKMLADTETEENIVDTLDMAVSVWPSLEYEQMFNDAWRLLRDYFYDTGMNGIDWVQMHTRYKNLVKRCSKREELDDVLAQMAAELSALHVFVYGGEYSDPMHGEPKLKKHHKVANLGATFERSDEYKGYVIKSIAHRDPDYNLMDGTAVYSPLSNQVLELSGQRGLEVGDVIVGVNGESVMRVPDLHMLLRGTAGRSVRLDVVRQPKVGRLDNNNATESEFKPEPVIAVPLAQEHGDNLRYAAWEYKTQQQAKTLAADKNFTVGYLHLRTMQGPEDIDAFTRGFFSDYDKQALIIDVRHNRGGNIDSWLLDILQRKAWMYWQGRATTVENGGLGWDNQFAFRGHIVVLIDECSSSDAEGFSRGVSELGLGRLVGTRTWGGGIWLSSDNHLVDGGIATAPEIGTYNDHFGWGLGIEQQGVAPDVEVDNNPRLTFDGKDQQLEKAIDVLAQWLQEEPIVQPKPPATKSDMSLHVEVENCPAK